MLGLESGRVRGGMEGEIGGELAFLFPYSLNSIFAATLIL
jgi:hypothetical protein